MDAVVSPCLPVGDDGERGAVFHSSFREWLIGRRAIEANKFVCDERAGHASIALYLGRKSQRGLGPEETLDLAHHLLKAQIFRPGGNGGASFSAKELQALWITHASADVSAALTCPKNILQPNLVVSKLLILAGASPDALTNVAGSQMPGVPFMNRLAAMGNLSMVRYLIDCDVDVTKTDSRGVSPLMIAAATDNALMCGEILRKRDDSAPVLCQSCNEGSTALSFASRNGALNALELLLAQPWPSSEYNREVAVREAIIAACKSGQVDALKVRTIS